MKRRGPSVTLEVWRCSTHGFVHLGMKESFGGTRLVGGKCCGMWNELLHTFVLERSALDEIETAMCAAEEDAGQ